MKTIITTVMSVLALVALFATSALGQTYSARSAASGQIRPPDPPPIILPEPVPLPSALPKDDFKESVDFGVKLLKSHQKSQINLRRLYYNGELTENYKVVNVIAGDTIVIRMGNEVKTVKLLGVESPKGNEKGAAEATAFTRKMITSNSSMVTLMLYKYRQDSNGNIVALVFAGDVISRDLLVDNPAADAKVINLQILLNGLAKYKSTNEFTKFLKNRMDAYQAIAMMNKLGIWKK